MIRCECDICKSGFNYENIKDFNDLIIDKALVSAFQIEGKHKTYKFCNLILCEKCIGVILENNHLFEARLRRSIIGIIQELETK